MDKSDDKRKGKNDYCCNDYSCVLYQMAYNNLYCATQNASDPKYVYSDRFVMLQKFCRKRQDKQVCCKKDFRNDDDCEIELKKKDWTNVTISLEELPYGGSCTYEVKAKCGYPQLVVNNTNIDMVVTFKKKEWSNDTYEPDDKSNFDDDEISNPRSNNNGKIEYHMKKKEKKDKNETECQKTKMYVTLTNLLNPYKPVKEPVRAEPRLLTADVSVAGGVTVDPVAQKYAMMSSTAAEQGADYGFFSIAFSTIGLIMVSSLAFIF